MKMSLKAARVNADMDQQQAADRMHVTRVTISYWENGKMAISDRQFEELCGVYGVPVKNVERPERR